MYDHDPSGGEEADAADRLDHVGHGDRGAVHFARRLAVRVGLAGVLRHRVANHRGVGTDGYHDHRRDLHVDCMAGGAVGFGADAMWSLEPAYTGGCRSLPQDTSRAEQLPALKVLAQDHIKQSRDPEPTEAAIYHGAGRSCNTSGYRA